MVFSAIENILPIPMVDVKRRRCPSVLSLRDLGCCSKILAPEAAKWMIGGLSVAETFRGLRLAGYEYLQDEDLHVEGSLSLSLSSSSVVQCLCSTCTGLDS